MLHDTRLDAPETRLQAVKVLSDGYELYSNLLMNGVWRHRAPHANRPTPPKKKYAWAMRRVAV